MGKIKKHSPEQRVSLLRQIEVAVANGKTHPIASREAGITEQTYYRWRKEYGGLQVEQPRGTQRYQPMRRADEDQLTHAILTLAERWRVHYNTVRPHSSLGYKPPAPQAWVGAEGNKDEHGVQRGAWESGKQRTLPTFPHPRLLRRDEPEPRCATLTIKLVQKIGQAISSPPISSVDASGAVQLLPSNITTVKILKCSST